MFLYFLRLNKNLNESSKRFVKGILIHELCHLESFKEQKFSKNLLNAIKYWLSKSERKKVERETDKTVISKGYAKDLYFTRMHSRKWRKKKGLNLDHFYMTPEEIKSYAQKIGKW